MKRTNLIRRFFTQHRRLLLLLLLPLAGCVIGILCYSSLSAVLPAEWVALLPIKPIDGGIAGAFAGWFSSCFQPLCLLLLLFLSGLSACGAPLIIAVPIFWGIGLGMSEAYYTQSGIGGWLTLAAVLLPHAVMEAVALLMGCSEALRMTFLVTVQMLPRSARCGGLWQDVRLYAVRFLLLAVLLIGAAVLDVILRLLLGGIL